MRFFAASSVMDDWVFVPLVSGVEPVFDLSPTGSSTETDFKPGRFSSSSGIVSYLAGGSKAFFFQACWHQTQLNL